MEQRNIFCPLQQSIRHNGNVSSLQNDRKYSRYFELLETIYYEATSSIILHENTNPFDHQDNEQVVLLCQLSY